MMNSLRSRLAFATIAAAMLLVIDVTPAVAFCVRNDIGSPIQVEALDDTASFRVAVANNEKACCEPKDEACAIGDDKVRLSITTDEGKASCRVNVGARGNVNITGSPDALKCKANKAGSTMDWASG